MSYPTNVKLSPYDYDTMVAKGLREWGAGFLPGDWMFYGHQLEMGACESWSNCKGHFYIVLPCSCLFDAGRRASNCGSPADKTHRCWIIEGEADLELVNCEDGKTPNVSLTKNGRTCVAGAGSIGHEHWHGFLRNGILTP